MVEALGEYGVFEGAVEDHVVFGTYQARGTWSPGLLTLLTELLGRGGTLIDGGANIGLLSIPVAERTSAHCIAIEPEPRNFGLLRRNIARHGLDGRIEAVQCALYSERRRLPMRRSVDNHGDHRVERDNPGTGLWVDADRLDGLLAGRSLKRPVVLKLDTQGCAAHALRGGAKLAPALDYLVCEYWPAGLVRQGSSVAELEQLLSDFPFAAILSDTQPGVALEPTPAVLQRLAWIPRDGSDEGFFDLLLARSR